MKSYQLICFSAFLLFPFCACNPRYSMLNDDPDKVKITLFYETYCPGSINFLKEQLLPSHKLLSENIILDLVPYGHATQEKVNGTWNFTCQHGPEECYGNKVHACANNQIGTNGQNKTLDFMACTMDTDYSDIELRTCADKSNMNWIPLRRCFSTSRSDDILAEYGTRTQKSKPAVKFVPMILFDDIFDRKTNNDARNDLMSVVCREFKKAKPEVCLAHEMSMYLERILNSL